MTYGPCGQVDSDGTASARPRSPCLKDLFDPTCMDLIVLERRRRVGCQLRAGLHTTKDRANNPRWRPRAGGTCSRTTAHPTNTLSALDPGNTTIPRVRYAPGTPEPYNRHDAQNGKNPSCHPQAPQNTQEQTPQQQVSQKQPQATPAPNAPILTPQLARFWAATLWILQTRSQPIFCNNQRYHHLG